jgi:hypothetical protein
MKPPPGPAAPGELNNSVDTEETGLPGFRSWRRVYLFVFAAFVLWVVLLAVLARTFS